MSEHVWKSQGVRQPGVWRLPVALAAIGMLFLGLPPSVASEPGLVRVSGECVGSTQADNEALAATQLSSYGIDAQVSGPTEVQLGESATVSVALSFELTDSLVDGAEVLGIGSATFVGTEFPVTLAFPGGDQQKLIVPPNPEVDLSAPTRIDLGSAEFDLPTDTPGVFRVRLDPATLAVETSPGDLSATATCTEDGYSELPAGFVIDPLAPTIDPAYEKLELAEDRRQGTVDLTGRVTAGAGPIVGDSWRIVSTRTTGEAAASIEEGVLTYDIDGAPVEIVWEVCGLSSEPAETETTTQDDNESPAEIADDHQSAEETAPSMHCAQGLLLMQAPSTAVLADATEVEGSATEALDSGSQTGGTQTPPSSGGQSSGGQSSGAPVSVTG